MKLRYEKVEITDDMTPKARAYFEELNQINYQKALDAYDRQVKLEVGHVEEVFQFTKGYKSCKVQMSDDDITRVERITLVFEGNNGKDQVISFDASPFGYDGAEVAVSKDSYLE